jgi:predicted amidohydrolase
MAISFPGVNMRNFKAQGFRVGLLLILAAAAAAADSAAQPPLRVAAVQLRINAEMLSSFAAYRERVASLVQQAAAFEPDLIVFPEYSGVFLALVPYAAAWSGGGEVSMEEAFAVIRRREPLAGSLEELFLLNSGLAGRALNAVFGGLARRYGVHILAGSYFAREEGPGGKAELRNRAVVFGPGGKRVYSQDKVFLTDFESGLLHLSPGSRRDAIPFRIAGRSLGLTLCRDTYDSGWVPHFQDVDVWIDIKANGVAYGEQERQSFLRALPARIEAGDVPLGLTVCLTGEFLDLFWEGESSLVRKESGSLRFLWRAQDPRGEEIAPLVLEPGPG